MLVSELDSLRSQVEHQITQDQSLDGLVDLAGLNELSEQFDVPLSTMKNKLQAVGGKVFKLGKNRLFEKSISSKCWSNWSRPKRELIFLKDLKQ